MLRALCCVGVFVAAFVSFASPGRAEPIVSGGETLVRLRVAPASAPTPAMRYRLLPDLQETNPGNPIQGYFRAFLAHEKFFVDEDATSRREELLAMPLQDLPVQEVQDYGRLVLSQVDRAARLDRPDWQILPRLKTEGFYLLLPDIQQLRRVANPLTVRFRGEVAQGRFDDAVRTAKTMFALGRHLGEHPTIIGELVGIAVVYKAVGVLEEMLEQPGCPNLYWALTALPTPFITMVPALEGEWVLLRAQLRDVIDAVAMDREQVKQIAMRWAASFGNGKPENQSQRIEKWLDAQVKDEARLTEARRRLVDSGLPAERLQRFLAEQVILLDEKRECLERFDDFLKTMTFPNWQAEAWIARLTRPKRAMMFADELLPSVTPARRAQGRLTQRIALLRHVEALRLYAAENAGALPATLAEVSTPLPDDPFTGKPFRYELRDGAAHLRGTPPAGEENNPGFNIHYVVTIQD